MSNPSDSSRSSVHVDLVQPTEMNTLRNLFQFYEYDFSEIEPSTIGSDGRFHGLAQIEFDYAYFFRLKGDLAGFALIRRVPSHLTPEEQVWSMEEFCVLRRYRRSSVGMAAARTVVSRHPGTWEVTQTPHNTAATSFWRKALAEFAFKDIQHNDPKWGPRPLQRFTTV